MTLVPDLTSQVPLQQLWFCSSMESGDSTEQRVGRGLICATVTPADKVMGKGVHAVLLEVSVATQGPSPRCPRLCQAESLSLDPACAVVHAHACWAALSCQALMDCSEGTWRR